MTVEVLSLGCRLNLSESEQLRALLSLIVIAVAIRMAFGLVIRPSDLYSLDVPH